jgi:hypothetical protein
MLAVLARHAAQVAPATKALFVQHKHNTASCKSLIPVTTLPRNKTQKWEILGSPERNEEKGMPNNRIEVVSTFPHSGVTTPSQSKQKEAFSC